MSKKSRNNKADKHQERRLLAWKLHQEGWSQVEIAKDLGVTQGAVSQWLKRGREDGVESLHRKTAPGRERALTDEQITQIPDLLDAGTNHYGFQADKWTTQLVAELFKQVFGISYHPSHVSRLLRKYCTDWRTRGSSNTNSKA